VKRLIGRRWTTHGRKGQSLVPTRYQGLERRCGRAELFAIEISAFIVRRWGNGEAIWWKVMVAALPPRLFQRCATSGDQGRRQDADLEVLRIINAPTMLHSHGLEECEQAVYDLGGGTFDVPS
jgi:hypothetical protein